MPGSENPITLIPWDWQHAITNQEIDPSIAIYQTLGTALTVTNATNASPIIITTSSNHGWVTGAYVVISGVAGNDAANGTWRIEVVNSTQFRLLGSVGNGNYTGGGTAQRIVSARAVPSYMGMMRRARIGLPWNYCSSTGDTPSPPTEATRPRRHIY